MADEKPAAAEAKKGKLPKGRHRSAIKRHRQSVKRAEQNQGTFSTIRTAMKKVRQSVVAKDKDQAEKALREATSLLHKAGQKGILHWKNAARHVSRLSSLVHRIGISA